MIEAINLCSIGYDAMELVQIAIELLLKAGSTLYLILDPYMTCGFHKHHGFLLLQFLLCLVCVRHYHSCKHWILPLGMKESLFTEGK